MLEPPGHPGIRSRPRMRREAKTVAAMIDIACTEKHATAPGELCDRCAGLLDYALLRLSKCPFQERKTSCANCRVHCYRPDMRELVREAMRTAGPRMPLRHPLMAFWHLLDGLRKNPARKR